MNNRKLTQIGLVTIMVASGLGYLAVSFMEPFRFTTVLTGLCLFNVMLGLVGLMALDMKKKTVM